MAKFKITYEYDIDTMEDALKLRDICHNCFTGNQDYIDSAILVYDNKHDMEADSYGETGLVIAFSELKDNDSFENMDALMETLGQATEFSASMKKSPAYINYLEAQMDKYEAMMKNVMSMSDDNDDCACDCCECADDSCDCDDCCICDDECECDFDLPSGDNDINTKEDNSDE